MTENKRPKAFFLNGGMGRIISAIPALEKYQEANTDPNFIIVIEGICDILNGHPTLDGKTYDCLLYTSPSPRDLSTSRMPSSA